MISNFSEQFKKYSKKQLDFIIAYLDTGTVVEAASKANVTESTAYNWLRGGLDKDIKSFRLELVEKQFDRLQMATGLAVDTLIDVIKSKNSSDGLKIKTSKIILDLTLKLKEHEQIIKRMEELEERLTEVYER